MPTITVRLLRGRTQEQKNEFAQLVRQAAVRTLGARNESVRVTFEEEDPGPRPAERSTV